MLDEHRSFFWLISVGSGRLSSGLVTEYRSWAEELGDRIHFMVLEAPERFNVSIFEGRSLPDAALIAKQRAWAVQRELNLPSSEVTPWARLRDQIGYSFQRERIYAQYNKDRSFERHCLSQTYSNLQPRFRRVGVDRKTHPKVKIAVNYLLEELAIKIGVFENGPFDGEIVPFGEMEVTKRIYSGHYFPCTCRAGGFRVITKTALGVSEELWPIASS
jgi:tRNA-dependent cyclodipeptide synthase